MNVGIGTVFPGNICFKFFVLCLCVNDKNRGLGLVTEFCSKKIPRNKTRNGFRYSEEESAHSEGFRGLWKSQFRGSEQKKIAWKKLVYQKIRTHKRRFCPRHASEQNSESLILLFSKEWNSEHFSPLRNGSEWNSESFLIRRMVQNRNPRVFFYFCSRVQNSEHSSPLLNGSERNFESFLFRGTPEFRWNKPIVSSIPSSAE
jgi:hypothetical protein